MAAIVESPMPEISAEEKVKKQLAEAERLANLSPGEYLLWAPGSAEHLGIPVEHLITAVKAILAKRVKDAQAAKTDSQREQRRTEKEQTKAQREQEREQKRIEKEATQRSKELGKEFKFLIKLPSKEQDARLVERPSAWTKTSKPCAPSLNCLLVLSRRTMPARSNLGRSPSISEHCWTS
jgi:hypothetical protein